MNSVFDSVHYIELQHVQVYICTHTTPFCFFSPIFFITIYFTFRCALLFVCCQLFSLRALINVFTLFLFFFSEQIIIILFPYIDCCCSFHSISVLLRKGHHCFKELTSTPKSWFLVQISTNNAFLCSIKYCEFVQRFCEMSTNAY